MASEVSLRKIGNKLAQQVDKNEKLIRRYEPSLSSEEVRIKAHNMAVEYVKENSQMMRDHDILNTKARLALVEVMNKEVYPTKSAALEDMIQKTHSDATSVYAHAVNANPVISKFVNDNKGWLFHLDTVLAPGKAAKQDRLYKNMVKEAHGVSSGDKEASDLLQAIRQVTADNDRALEQHGIKIPKVEEYSTPRTYSYTAVSKAGKQAFIDDGVKHLSIEKMNKHREIQLNSEKELVDYLDRVYTDMMRSHIGTDAYTTSRQSLGELLEKGSSRKFYFKDADSEIAFMEKYSANTFFQDVLDELESQSRRVASVRRWGPDPSANYKYASIVAKQDMISRKLRGRTVAEKIADPAINTDTQWATLTGATKQVENKKIAAFFKGIRDYLVSTKLGGLLLAQITGDSGQILAHSKALGLSGSQILKDTLGLLTHLSPKEKLEVARQFSVGLENLVSTARRENMLTDEVVLGRMSTISHDFADAIIRGQGALKLQKASKDASALNLNKEFAEHTGVRIQNLPRHIKTSLDQYEISDKDWLDISASEKTVKGRNSAIHVMLGGDEYFEFQIIDINRLWEKNPDAAIKYTTMITELTRRMILEPGIAARAITTQGAAAGTFAREGASSFLQFKSFGIEQLMRNLRTIVNDPRISNRTQFAAKLTAISLMGGLMTEMLVRWAKGDNVDLTDPNLHLMGVLRGSGFGIATDPIAAIKFKDNKGGISKQGASLLAQFAGPAPNFMFGVVAALLAAGEEPNVKTVKKIMKWAEKNTPGSNLWYKRIIESQLRARTTENIAFPDRAKKRQEVIDKMKSGGLGE